MADELVGRYRRTYTRIWRHPVFQQLTPNEQRVALYLLTGPQGNRIGLFHFSVATAAEDLSLGLDTTRKAVEKVTDAFGWRFDAKARMVYIPTWWRWNRPDNVNVLRGNLKDVSELAHCSLVQSFATNLQYLPLNVHEAFLEGLGIRHGQPSPIQEQKLETVPGAHQDQETPLRWFQQFASLYPAHRRSTWDEVRREFATAIQAAGGAQLLLDSLSNHLESEQWQDPNFIPSMKTWLKGERWAQRLPRAKKSAVVAHPANTWRTDCGHVRRHRPGCATLAHHLLRSQIQDAGCTHDGTCTTWEEHNQRQAEDQSCEDRDAVAGAGL